MKLLQILLVIIAATAFIVGAAVAIWLACWFVWYWIDAIFRTMFNPDMPLGWRGFMVFLACYIAFAITMPIVAWLHDA